MFIKSVLGPLCVSAGTTELQYGYKPLHLYQGELSCVTLTGKLDTVRLQSHFYSDTQDIIDSEVIIIMIYIIVYNAFCPFLLD